MRTTLGGMTLALALGAGCNALSGVGDFSYDRVATAAATPGATSASTSSGGGAGGGQGGAGTAAGGGGAGGVGGAPQLGQALSLDGRDDHVVLPNTDTLTAPAGSKGFSWELWLWSTAVDAEKRTLFGAMDTEACEDIFLGFGTESTPSQELAFKVDGKGKCPAVDDDPIRVGGLPAQTWIHVAAVADYASGAVRLYVDGMLAASNGAFGGQPLGRSLFANVGRFFDNGTSPLGSSRWYFAGRIDELRIYDRPLDDAEVTQLYAGGAGTKEPAAGVVAGWHFDGDLVDYVGDLDGTAKNGASFTEGKVPE
jgi:hypothetical protein